MKLANVNDLPTSRVSHNSEISRRVMLDGDDLPGGVRFAEAVFPPGESVSAHSHAGLTEIFFFTEGEGCARINGKDYTVREGSCLKVEPDETHEISNTGMAPLRVVYFALPTAV